jgi:hypothetical protein
MLPCHMLSSQFRQTVSFSPCFSFIRPLSVSAFSSLASPFDFELSTINCPSLSPFPAALTSSVQPAENIATLNPVSVNVDAASSISPLFATLTENTGGGGAMRVSDRFLPGTEAVKPVPPLAPTYYPPFTTTVLQKQCPSTTVKQASGQVCPGRCLNGWNT